TGADVAHLRMLAQEVRQDGRAAAIAAGDEDRLLQHCWWSVRAFGSYTYCYSYSYSVRTAGLSKSKSNSKCKSRVMLPRRLPLYRAMPAQEARVSQAARTPAARWSRGCERRAPCSGAR